MMDIDKDIALALIYFGTAAIFAILVIVLLVLTPFIPDEVIAAVISLISGGFGVDRLIRYRRSANLVNEDKNESVVGVKRKEPRA
jgi:hypothetical protein